MKHGCCEAVPSFTGLTSGENVTEVVPSTDDPYLIQADEEALKCHAVPLFGVW